MSLTVVSGFSQGSASIFPSYFRRQRRLSRRRHVITKQSRFEGFDEAFLLAAVAVALALALLRVFRVTSAVAAGTMRAYEQRADAGIWPDEMVDWE